MEIHGFLVSWKSKASHNRVNNRVKPLLKSPEQVEANCGTSHDQNTFTTAMQLATVRTDKHKISNKDFFQSFKSLTEVQSRTRQMRVPNIVKIRPKPLKYNLQQTARAHVHTNAHTVQFIKGGKKAILQCLRRTKPTLLSSFQNFDESIFGNINVAKFSHLLFAFCLTFEQLHLSGDVSAVLKQSKTMHEFHTILPHISGDVSAVLKQSKTMHEFHTILSHISGDVSTVLKQSKTMHEFHTILSHISGAISSTRHNEIRWMNLILPSLKSLIFLEISLPC